MISIPTNPAFHLLFDAAAWGGGLVSGLLLYRWRLKVRAVAIARVADPGYFIALSAGAIIGAYAAGSFTFLGGGVFALAHSVAGALAGAIVGVEINKMVRGVKLSTGVIFAGPFAIGVAIGRWGCLFAGIPDQTFGIATQLPWAVDLGDGTPRHPVQIYESLSMAGFAVAYVLGLNFRSNWAMRDGFYWMAIFYGVQRFLWEFLKPYATLFGPFNHFHFLSAGLVIYGFVMLRRRESET